MGGVISKPGAGGGGIGDWIDPATGQIKPVTIETRAEESARGESPKLIRNIFCRAGTKEALEDLVAGLGIEYGTSHPDAPDAFLVDINYEEKYDEGRQYGVPFYTATIKATYSVITGDGAPNDDPLTRPDTWSFQTQGASIAALFYFDGSTLKPMANSAGDPIKGLQVDEAMQKIVIKGNRASFPSGLAASVTNCTNDSTYLGFPPGYVKCQGIGAEYKYDSYGYGYWEVTAELLGRQTGWDLLIPDAGYNYISGGEKKRCWVWAPNPDPDTNQLITDIKVPSADMVALDGSGGMSSSGDPAILTRQIYKRVSFDTLFGSPPS